jgi:hypothetical protein
MKRQHYGGDSSARTYVSEWPDTASAMQDLTSLMPVRAISCMARASQASAAAAGAPRKRSSSDTAHALCSSGSVMRMSVPWKSAKTPESGGGAEARKHRRAVGAGGGAITHRRQRRGGGAKSAVGGGARLRENSGRQRLQTDGWQAKEEGVEEQMASIDLC